MRYFKSVSDGLIMTIGSGNGGEEITEQEYNDITAALKTRPQKEGFCYKLREDLTWAEYPVDPPDPDPEIDDTELLDILMGGAT